MKKQAALVLVIGLLLAPALFRATFPALYGHIWRTYPFAGAVLVMLLDIVWLWLTLLVVIASLRLVRWLRAKTYKEDNLKEQIS
ncbi:hypothetical protein [Spirosoma sp. KNUC1025]|uniref:hypothetical protein n=1 Tax=Spirosoma sp. KNUC1025 TaxID=2894082 RepID=UPI003864C55C|nr:hypothetical protein LN737_05100 [Spirosoma sp. KNUC1025]